MFLFNISCSSVCVPYVSAGVLLAGNFCNVHIMWDVLMAFVRNTPITIADNRALLDNRGHCLWRSIASLSV